MFFCKILELDKFEGGDLNYDNSFLKFYLKITQKNAFLVPNLGIFVFSQNFSIRQNWRWWFQTWQFCFEILAHEYPKKSFFVANLGIFVFSEMLAIWQIWGWWFQIWQYVFKILVQNYTKKAFLVPTLGILFFLAKISCLTNLRLPI